MLRILLCVPTTTNLNQIPEIRELTSTHSVAVLNGNVTANDLYQQCKNQFDIIHFGGHGGPQGIQLSETELLSPSDIAQLCRMARCKILYLNVCDMGIVAGYVSRHGGIRNNNPHYIIYSQIKLPDSEAWQRPLTFYNEIKAQQTGAITDSSILAAYQTADADGTLYNMLVSPTFIETLLLELESLRKQYGRDKIAISPYQLLTMILMATMVMISLITTYIILTR